MTSQKETSLKGPPTSYSLFSKLQAEPICVSECSAAHSLTVAHPKLKLYVNITIEGEVVLDSICCNYSADDITAMVI